MIGGSVSDGADLFVPIVNGAPSYSFVNKDGRQLANPRSLASPAVFVVLGQSLTSGHDQTDYTPANSNAVFQLNVYDGGLYRAVDPLLGGEGTGGSYSTRLADKWVADGKYQSVVLVPIAVGGTTVAMWAPGGQLNHKIGVAARRLAALALSCSGVIWTQGEQDAFNGLSQASYAASLAGVISTFRVSGIAAPFFVALETWINGSQPAGAAAIRAAQAAVVDNVGVFQAGDTDTLGNSFRYDNTHWTAAGSDAAANLHKAAINLHI